MHTCRRAPKDETRRGVTVPEKDSVMWPVPCANCSTMDTQVSVLCRATPRDVMNGVRRGLSYATTARNCFGPSMCFTHTLTCRRAAMHGFEKVELTLPATRAAAANGNVRALCSPREVATPSITSARARTLGPRTSPSWWRRRAVPLTVSLRTGAPAATQ
jgi:hypothetical protein